jgi:hypothetical protein
MGRVKNHLFKWVLEIGQNLQHSEYQLFANSWISVTTCHFLIFSPSGLWLPLKMISQQSPWYPSVLNTLQGGVWMGVPQKHLRQKTFTGWIDWKFPRNFYFVFVWPHSKFPQCKEPFPCGYLSSVVKL